MARPLHPSTKVETKPARARIARGVTQEELAQAIGVSIATYLRLARGQMPNPPRVMPDLPDDVIEGAKFQGGGGGVQQLTGVRN